jgi:FlaA1/EpsC-like NDP-sugar epimerase
MVGVDLISLPCLMLLALMVKSESGVPTGNLSNWLIWMVPIIAVPMLAFAGLYRTVIRYIELDLIAVSGGVLALLCLLAYGISSLFPEASAHRQSLVIYWFMAFSYVVASRLLARGLLRRGVYAGHHATRAAIYGAGEAGMQLAQAMRYSHEYKPVCFVDDNPQRQNRSVGGLKVHKPDNLDSLVLARQIALVVIAAPSASMQERRAMMQRVQDCGVPVKILPALTNMVDARFDITQIRDVELEDLLGRTPVEPDGTLLSQSIVGRAVLVTGAGGSIGSELCRQVLAQNPTKLVLLDHSEFALYAIHQELESRAALQAVPLVPVLGSVQDQKLLVDILASHHVETVYHAAAYKHVPLVESNIKQGVLNNVVGTWTLQRAVEGSSVRTCILISTDKAVRPTNVMGASKRIAELIFQAAAVRQSVCTFAMVRFGNVLGSSGSVVPLFRHQLDQGGPITLTHPEITRYFMLIPEATQLVIQAGAMARGGEVFVLDMGDPVKIIDLARTLIRLSGLTERTAENPQGDIEIRSVGLRPGEKLFEELLIGDDVVPSSHPRIMCARERHVDPALLENELDRLLNACRSGNTSEIMQLVRNLVPEYRPAEEVNSSALIVEAAALMN